jgi:hypothetical protein
MFGEYLLLIKKLAIVTILVFKLFSPKKSVNNLPIKCICYFYFVKDSKYT